MQEGFAMAESSADNEPKKEMTSKQISLGAILILVITILTLMFGPNILGQIHSYLEAKQPPTFEF